LKPDSKEVSMKETTSITEKDTINKAAFKPKNELETAPDLDADQKPQKSLLDF